MVGIPRSQGCHACRKRKKKCSLETPECLVCVKAGRKCPGYERGRKFVHHGAKSIPWKAAHRGEDAADASAAGPADEEPERSAREDTQLALSNVSTASAKSLMTRMSRNQLMEVFVSHYGARNTQAPRDHFMVEAIRAPQMSNILYVSMLAFGAAKIGRISNDTDMVRAGHRMYAKGLHELQNALWDPQQMYLDSTLGACVLLALYETNECPSESRTGFQSHFDGCAALMKARGPNKHASGLGHSIFCSIRVMGAFEGMVHKKTFLADPLWKDVPFSQGEKTPLDCLVDMMLEIPALLACADEITVMKDIHLQANSAFGLLDWTILLEERIAQFYRNLEATTGPLAWPAVKSSDGFESDDDLLPTYFAFKDFHLANICMLCWATQTLLFAIITQLQVYLAPHDSPTRLQSGLVQWTLISDQSIKASNDSTLEMGRRVCQSVEFCLHTSPYTGGPPTVMAPMRCVLDTIGPWPEFQAEAQWIRRTLTRVQQRGMAIVPYLHQVPSGYQ